MKVQKILKRVHKAREQREIEQGHRQGYWLVRESDKERFYISERICSYSLEKVADKVLNDKTGWNYWIDYCMGLDVTGRVAWRNMDCSDSFI